MRGTVGQKAQTRRRSAGLRARRRVRVRGTGDASAVTMYSSDSTESPGSSMLVSNSVCNVTVVRPWVPRARRLGPPPAVAAAADVDGAIGAAARNGGRRCWPSETRKRGSATAACHGYGRMDGPADRIDRGTTRRPRQRGAWTERRSRYAHVTELSAKKFKFK